MGQQAPLRRGSVHRIRTGLRRLSATETTRTNPLTLLALLLLTALCLVFNVVFGPAPFPVLCVVVPLVLAGLLLPPRPLLAVVAATFMVVIAENLGAGNNLVHPGAYVVLGIVAAIDLQQSAERERLGLSAGRGEQMLLELRDRLRIQGEVPVLPPAWHAEVQLESAGGASFGGDFIVSTLTDGGSSLELALVDVSGKGVDAGTRALMLSGTMGGLLGAMPAARFLSSANDYLIRQDWEEGFATAMHLTLDLTSGKYCLRNAGHLPAVHYRGGSGRWELVEPQGTVLGVLPEIEVDEVDGELRPYDALLLFTDGVVEVPGRDLSLGIDNLLGGAERLVSAGFHGAARRLLRHSAVGSRDDRAIVLIWRT